MESTKQEQAPMVEATPQQEHQWLQQLVGEWAIEGEAAMAPGQPPEKFTGTESVRSIGGLWTLGEGNGCMPDGSPAISLLTLGYDPDKGRFVGTFIASMMTYLWLYDGELDASSKVLTLSAEGPDFSNPGKKGKYQDIIEIKDTDHRVFSSQMLDADGKWQEFMRANYRRTK